MGEQVICASDAIPRLSKASCWIRVGDAAFVRGVDLMWLVTSVCIL